jgi:hypothetical protein
MPEWVLPDWNHKALACWAVAVFLLCVAAAAGSDGSDRQRKAIDSGAGVLLNDYDGHGHRTAPKRVGEIIGLWCESTTGERQAVTVRVFLEARELTTKTLACPADLGYRRHTKIIRARHVGVYGMVLSGAGFDSYVIRTHVLPADR